MIEFVDLFLTLAEIAGIFVGFGALIGVTRGSEIKSSQLGLIRGVVTTGLVVIVAALVPVLLSNYGAVGHDLWFYSSCIFLVILWAAIILPLRRSELRALLVGTTHSNPLAAAFFWLILEIPIHVLLILILIDLFPRFESAFYTTAIVFHLFQAAFVLVQLVYSGGSHSSDQTAA